MKPWLLFGLSSLLLACGGGRHSSVDLGELLDAERMRAAAAVAPELVEEAEVARRQAEAAEARGKRASASDRATEGRLLLAAATVELSRSEAAERRSVLEEEMEALERAANEDESARVALERQIAREVASALALSEAQSAAMQAAEDEPRRYRRHAEERRSMHRRAAAVVVRRARLASSAARSLGAEADELDALGERLARAEQAQEPAESLHQADEVEVDLSRLLLHLRAEASLPAPEVARRFEEDARRAGFEVRREARGMVLGDSDFFDPRSSRPVSSRYDLLLALLRDYPEGAVRAEVYGPIDRQRRSQARADRLVASLAADGIAVTRLAAEAVGSDATEAGGVRLDALFVAYHYSVE